MSGRLTWRRVLYMAVACVAALALSASALLALDVNLHHRVQFAGGVNIIDQQRAMAAMLAKKFGRDPRVRYVNLGRLIDIRDRNVAYDGLHLVAGGNMRVADALLDQVMEMIAAS